MFSTINSHCFGNSFSDQIKQLYQLTLFPWKCLLRTKWAGLSWTWRNNLPTLLIPQTVFCKCSVIGTFTAIPVNYAKCINAYFLLLWLLLYNALLHKCFTQPIYVTHVSFQHHLRFFHSLINLRAKKVGVVIQKFRNFVTVTYYLKSSQSRVHSFE